MFCYARIMLLTWIKDDNSWVWFQTDMSLWMFWNFEVLCLFGQWCRYRENRVLWNLALKLKLNNFKCNKYRIKGWPVILGVCICYVPTISIGRLRCPGHDALTMLYTLHGEVMCILGLVFMRTFESTNQFSVITCCDHSNSPAQSC